MTCEAYCRDLLDGKKDNLQVKENKLQGLFVSGVTEVRFLFEVGIISLDWKATVRLF